MDDSSEAGKLQKLYIKSYGEPNSAFVCIGINNSPLLGQLEKNED